MQNWINLVVSLISILEVHTTQGSPLLPPPPSPSPSSSSAAAAATTVEVERVHEHLLRRAVFQSCTDPGTPRNGFRILMHGEEQFQVGDIITYQCKDGYQLIGSSSVLLCIFNQSSMPSWNVSLPQCVGE